MTRVSIGRTVALDGLEILSVEETTVDGRLLAGKPVVFGARRLVALVVRSAGGARALDPDGDEVDVDDLARAVPELRAWLAQAP